MLHITPRLYADALELDTATAYRRLKPLAHTIGPRGEHHYPLITALTTTRPKEREHLPDLFDSATDMPGPMPANAERLADEFDLWLRQHGNNDKGQQGAITRLAMVRRAFCTHLADSQRSSLLLKESEYLRAVLPLDNAMLKFVVRNDRESFPTNFKTWAVAFALTHTPQQQYNEAA
tara:strand:+ start:176 stop:706 length:531 start_codon:yes stop_codon:yes gene_type:complete